MDSLGFTETEQINFHIHHPAVFFYPPKRSSTALRFFTQCIAMAVRFSTREVPAARGPKSDLKEYGPWANNPTSYK